MPWQRVESCCCVLKAHHSKLSVDPFAQPRKVETTSYIVIHSNM
jgi:hypothetical protein